MEKRENPVLKNPIHFSYSNFVTDSMKILESAVIESGKPTSSRQFIRAGPRSKIVFDPKQVKAAIVRFLKLILITHRNR